MEIRVAYSDWLVGDGDEPVHVGQPWDVTIVVRPAGGTPMEWRPRLRPGQEQRTGLWPVEGGPATSRLVGDVVDLREHEFSGPWVGIEAGGWRMAAPGRHAGRVEGDVVLDYDTYMIDDEALRAYATQRVEVVGITHVAGRYRRAGRRGDYELVGWEPPRPVADTHELGVSPAPVPGEFVITCRLPEGS